jgi:hypothetical protein
VFASGSNIFGGKLWSSWQECDGAYSQHFTEQTTTNSKQTKKVN